MKKLIQTFKNFNSKKPLLVKFLAENSIEGDEGVPMSLEQLGISISTEGKNQPIKNLVFEIKAAHWPFDI